MSEADLAANALIEARLRGARPDYGWLSEETQDDPDRLTRARVFVVDPLDGTISFLKGREDFTVSLAVVADGRPVAAAIVAPMPGEVFSAAEGAGATLDGATLRVGEGPDAIEGCRMIGPRDMFAHPAWPTPWPPMDIRRVGSIAYRLAQVAAGRADATLALSTKCDWDLAAGDLIAREAGAVSGTHQGERLAFNRESTSHLSLLAAAPRLHRALLARVGGLRLPRGNRQAGRP